VGRPLAGRSFLFAVADGMGGAPAGEVAADLAIDTIYRSLLDRADLPSLSQREAPRALLRAVEEANARIYRMGRSSPQHRGMGATMTAVLLTPGGLQYSHVGDSRAYLLRNGTLQQLTRDHSLYTYLVEDCRKSPEEAEEYRNVILQALGVKADVEVDTGSVPLQAGDRVLVCSDGLTNMMEDSEIQGLLTNAPSVAGACGTLMSEALQRGGLDNITIIAIQVLGGAPSSSPAVDTRPS
jgi:protein phosphatase